MKSKRFDVREMSRLLSYFSENIEVCIEDHATGALCPIEDVTGESEKDANGKFLVRIHIRGGK